MTSSNQVTGLSPGYSDSGIDFNRDISSSTLFSYTDSGKYLPHSVIRSSKSTMCGEENKPVFNPDSLKMEATIIETEPLPFDPAT